MDYDIYNNTIINGLYGLGAAESVYLLVMVVALALLGWGLSRRWSSE
jgi:ABC-type sugar transport system permease subunit